MFCLVRINLFGLFVLFSGIFAFPFIGFLQRDYNRFKTIDSMEKTTFVSNKIKLNVVAYRKKNWCKFQWHLQKNNRHYLFGESMKKDSHYSWNIIFYPLQTIGNEHNVGMRSLFSGLVQNTYDGKNTQCVQCQWLFLSLYV